MKVLFMFVFCSFIGCIFGYLFGKMLVEFFFLINYPHLYMRLL